MKHHHHHHLRLDRPAVGLLRERTGRGRLSFRLLRRSSTASI